MTGIPLSKVAEAMQKVAKRPPRPKRRSQPEPYPDYRKSLVTQMQTDPTKAGLRRAAFTAPLGAILGALIAAAIKNNPELIAGGAGLGALAGGIPGYVSGQREAESDKTKWLALRRLGLETPGELEVAEQFPNLVGHLSEEGVRL